MGLLANKIRDVSTENPIEVGATPGIAASISGKLYRFDPNALRLKSLSLFLTGPQPHYDVEIYARDATTDPRFSGPIGLDGLHRKGELTHHGFNLNPESRLNERLEGSPQINAAKGTWQDDHTFAIDRFAPGQGEPPERWTLTFNGEKVNVRVKFGTRPEISIDGDTSG